MEEMEENYEVDKEFLAQLKQERPTYKDMIDFCADDMVLNNDLCTVLINHGIYFDTYCGDQIEYFDNEGNQITEDEYYELDGGVEQYKEIYQYFIISSGSAERFAKYTNELVIYNEDLDLYLLCVTHWGTLWEGVSANWKRG